MFRIKIMKVGNSLGLIIPAIEVEYNDFKEGEWLEVRITRDSKKSLENEDLEG